MQRFLPALLCLLIYSALWGQAPAQPPPPPPPVTTLVNNPDFSVDKDGDKWPDGWGKVDGVTWEAEGDVHFLRFHSATPGKMVLLYHRVDLPTPPPAALDIRVRVRYKDIVHGKENWNDGRVMGHFKNAAEQVVTPEPDLPAGFLGTSDGWVTVSRVIKVPRTAQFLELMPCLFQVNQGTLDLGSCQVLPASAYLLPMTRKIPSDTIVPAKTAVLPPVLHVEGNQVKTADGKSVWLQGLCVDSLEWGAGGEHIEQSIPVAIDSWKANVIRLPVKENFWFGHGPWQGDDGGLAYRKIVDAVIEAAANRGAYVVLDQHGFGAPQPEDVDFWRDAATRYKNHPAVLFELLNEPVNMSWKEWRDGGMMANADLLAGSHDTVTPSPGMQGLLDVVRSTGAHNIVIAGGLDFSFNLTGVQQGFALTERPGGHGVIYSAHFYPWTKNWQKNVLCLADDYPLFLGEVGCPSHDWKGFDWVKVEWRIPDLDQWCADMIGMIQQHHLNWTAFSFHPTCGPNVIQDWQYTPTPYWGVFVKDALAGKQFTGKRLR